jgi:hypothetical protein
MATDGALLSFKDFRYADGGVYKGQVQAGTTIRDGTGDYSWPNTETRYIGDWKSDQINGNGQIFYENSDTYTGAWENNKKCGQGTFYWASGNEYTGCWADDKMSGDGELKFVNGDCFSGNFVDGKRYGQGTLTYKNGDYYSGNWAGNKMHGLGHVRSHRQSDDLPVLMIHGRIHKQDRSLGLLEATGSNFFVFG